MTAGEVPGVISEGIDDKGEPVEDIDERRLNRRAYDYLCRLLEVRTWLQDCLKVSEDSDLIPPVTELETHLSNGVLLARLGNAFAPDVVPMGKIFDADQKRYRETESLHYRHTDNIMLWRRAMESVRLPEVFIPETVDVYEGRNMKTIFCLYALAFHLYRLRKAPAIRNQAGNAVFTQDDMDVMKEHLKDSKLPEFGDVGGILSDKRMSSDEAAAALALRAIATAVSNKDSPALLTALQSHDAGIFHVESALAVDYLDSFVAKGDLDFTKASVQAVVLETNDSWASRHLDSLLLASSSNGGSPLEKADLYAIFDALQIEDIREKALPLYSRLLVERRTRKGAPLTSDEIKHIVQEANALVEVKVAAEHGSSLDSFHALLHGVLALDPNEDNAKLYHDKLQSRYRGASPDFFLLRDDLADVIAEFSTLSDEDRKYLELRAAVRKGDHDTVIALLQHLSGPELFVQENAEYYPRQMETMSTDRYTADTVVGVLKYTNQECAAELRRANLVIDLNKALETGREDKVLQKAREVGPVLRPSSFRHDLAERYVEKLLQHKLPLPPGIVSNGHSTSNGQKPNGDAEEPEDHIEEYFHHEFRLGGIWIETEERTWYSRKRTPEVDGYLTANEIVDLIEEENAAYDADVADAKERAEREEAAKKIQGSYRKWSLQKDSLELRAAVRPSLRLVRKFVAYLQDKDYDTNEELEIERSKATVTQLVVANRHLDRDLTELDEKIGLLIKNRLNLQDVIADKNKIAENAAKLTSEETIKRKDRAQTDALEQLFYHLQSSPEYLANYLDAQNTAHLDAAFASIVAPTFSFLTETREEYLIVRLLCELARRDISEIVKPDDLGSSRRAPIVASALGSSLFDNTKGKVVDILTDDLKAFFATENKENQTFNLDPLDIYASMYPGTKLTDAQTALDDDNVKAVLEESKSFLAEWSERFTATILANHKLPKPVLYLLAYVYDELRKRFPGAALSDQHKAVAELAYETWIYPSLTNARHLTASTGKETSDEGLGKMVAVAKFMQYCVANKGYGNAKWYLSSLNKQIHTINVQFRQFIYNTLSGISFADDLYPEYSSYQIYDPVRRPLLPIHGTHIKEIVASASKNIEPMAQGAETKNFRALVVNVAAFASTIEEDRTHVLYLHPMPSTYSYDSVEEAAVQRKIQEDFVKSKKMIVDLLLAGVVGSTIAELLDAKAPSSVEEIHQRLFNDEKFENIAAKQAAIREVLGELEKAGRVSAADDHQSIVTDIANDIRMATVRRKERAAQRKHLEDTESRLNSQRGELKDRLTQYEKYLDTCLENLNKTSKYASFRPTTEKAGKLTKARSSTAESTRSTHKTNLEKMFRKGIVTDNKLPGSDNARKSAKWQVEFTRSDRKGVFDVRVLDNKEPLGEYTIDFQDLLQAQHRSETQYAMKDALVFSIPELIGHINRKFYGK